MDTEDGGKCISSKRQQEDSVWSWFVCGLGLISSILILGFLFSFGVLNPVLLEDFRQGKARTAWVGSLCMACASFFGPLAAKLCDRLGCRAVSISGALICIVSLLTSSQVPYMWMLYFTFSCMYGFGASCVHTALFLVVSASFDKGRSLATGTLVAGHAAGIMIVSPVLQVLLDSFGWRTSFLIWAGLTSPICVFGFFFHKNLKKEPGYRRGSIEHQDESSSHTFTIWRHPPFVVYTVSTVILYLGLHIPQVHMASFCRDLGIQSKHSSMLYLGFGLASVIARLVVGKLCDKRFHAQHIFQVAGFVMGVATLLCPVSSRSYALLMLYFVTFGFAEGSSATPINYLILNCIPDTQRSKSFGFWLFFLSFTMAIGPPFAGFIADELGSYIPAFYMSGSFMMSSALVVFVLRYFKNRDDLPLKDDQAQIMVALVERETVL